MTEKWIICPVCRGEGSHVHPAIDCNGLTGDDFADDPDFAEDYFAGRYDVRCSSCRGAGKVTREGWRERERELSEHAAGRRLAAMEDGDVEGYFGAGDYRWG